MVRFSKIHKYDICLLFYFGMGFEITILEIAIILLCVTLVVQFSKYCMLEKLNWLSCLEVTNGTFSSIFSLFL